MAEAKPVYVIVGGSGGIGSAVCRRLAETGAVVIPASRPSDRLDRLAEELAVEPYPLDATQCSQVDGCLQSALQRYGRLDGVANCVGSLLLKPAHLTSEEDWHGVLGQNLTSAFAVVRAAGRLMTSGGSVVLVSSVAGRVGLANHEAIAAAKAGVIGLTLAAAATYAARGLRVNCVAPGLVRTPMTARLTNNELALKASTAMHPLGRIGEPEDVAHVIAWLLGPHATWVTGQVFGIDGGLSTVRPAK